MPARNVFVSLQQFCEFDDAPLRLLREAGFAVDINTSGRRIQEEEIPAALRDKDAVLAAVEPYTRAVLAKIPTLKCISRCGVGVESIDLDAARAQNITVLNTPDEVVQPVAEMAVGMILGLVRNLSLHSKEISNGKWIKHYGLQLSELTVGLVGFGRIGQTVESLLRPFRPRVIVHDPFPPKSGFPPSVKAVSLETLLAESDVVSLHASRPEREGALIGAREIDRMKRGSRLVNTSRGFLVDDKALSGALASGHLAGAALDVYEAEPYKGDLVRFPNVILTPHVATLTRASRIAMERKAAQNIVDFFKSQ